MFNYSTKIGQGRSSVVFLSSGLAIKRVEKALFRKEESEILRELSHPYIIKIFRIFEETSYVYIELEYFLGKNLYDWRMNKSLENDDMFYKIITQLLDVVRYLHNKDVIYGDLSVTNVLINDVCELKLIDFGNCSKIDVENNSVGTFAFLSPELLSGEVKRINKMSELWALGMLIFVVLTGNIPFQGNNENTLYHRIMNNKISYKNVPKKYKKLLKSLLRKKYNKRKIIDF